MHFEVRRLGDSRRRRLFMCSFLTKKSGIPPFTSHSAVESEKGGQGGFTPVMLRYERYLKPYSRRLRREMTDAEQRLWFHIRRKRLEGVQFYRQKPIGRYIVDFYAPAANLVVELDGGQHFDAAGIARDAARDGYLRKLGLRVLRFDDGQMLCETDAVVEAIWREIVKGR
jgi:very-short-patch-repair endonuclease